MTTTPKREVAALGSHAAKEAGLAEGALDEGALGPRWRSNAACSMYLSTNVSPVHDKDAVRTQPHNLAILRTKSFSK